RHEKPAHGLSHAPAAVWYKQAVGVVLPHSRFPADMAYWLFKSEPTAYSFADLLAEPDRTTGWDGVRNYQARNFLRDQVQVGDGVLFYHSSAEPPAIVGIAEVVRAGHPDPTAFDPKAEHYDPRSDRANPTWYQVAIRAVHAIDPPLDLPFLSRAP